MPKGIPDQKADVPAAAVREQLASILGSPAFRASKRCQDFLTFVIERALEGAGDSLRERTIGVEVFGRAPSYDTHEDSVVRVTANEVRRRLAQYYQQSVGQDLIRVEIPSGAYVPEIRYLEQPEDRTEPRRRVGSVALAGAATVLVVTAALGITWFLLRPSALDRFWAPVFESRSTIEVQLGQSNAYQLSRRVQDNYLRKHPEYLRNLTPYLLTPTPDLDIQLEDIVPVSDLYVSVADALVVARLGAFLRGREKEYRLSLHGTQPAPVSQVKAPSILIGAFSNLHTIQTTRDLRFRFRRDLTSEGAVWMIEDSKTGKSWKLINVFPRQQTDTDYALVTRLLDSESRRVTVAFGGLTQYGTEGATEVLTDAKGLSKLDEYLGSGWEKKNLQFVVEMRVAVSTPVAPKIVLAHAW